MDAKNESSIQNNAQVPYVVNTLQITIADGRWWSENSKGPRLLPCGTPDKLLNSTDFSEPIITRSFRFVKYD